VTLERRRRAPDFIVVGGARCGTTTLYSWLRSHSAVFMPAWKEPSYFLPHEVDYGVRSAVEYYALFAEAGDRIVGEASAGYLADPTAPGRIRDELGDVRIIILLRDPVARAFSLWRWMVGRGLEPIRTFEHALVAETARERDPASMAGYRQSIYDYLYLRSGFYSHQVEAYQRAFSDVLVLLSDDLAQQPQEAFARVCAFLGVPPMPVTPGPSNESGMPRWVRSQVWARRGLHWLWDRTPTGATVAERGLWKAMELNQRFGPSTRIDPATEGRLREAYAADIERTAQLARLDLSAWAPVPV